jgi:hypothetical protein
MGDRSNTRHGRNTEYATLRGQMNVHPHLHEAHFPFRTCSARSCTGRMHVHPAVPRMNVHPVLHLHGISGTI